MMFIPGFYLYRSVRVTIIYSTLYILYRWKSITELRNNWTSPTALLWPLVR